MSSTRSRRSHSTAPRRLPTGEHWTRPACVLPAVRTNPLLQTASTSVLRPRSSTDQDRFSALLDAHRGILHKVAATYCRHPEDRRDLVQEITAQLWRAFPRYDAAHPFPTWTYRIALNVAISHVRRMSLRRASLESYDDHGVEPVDADTLSPEASDRVKALYQVIERLGAFDRALLLLHLEGYRHAEIGEILGISTTNSSTKLSRLTAQLQTELTSDPHDL